MKCIRPLKVSQDINGDLIYSTTKAIPGLIGFELECRKCLPCRLNQAKEKATRSYHQSKIYKDNIFLTLTYNDKNLLSPRLQYRDFQLFIKKLREHITRKHITAETLLTEGEGRSTRVSTSKRERDKNKKTKINTTINYMVTGEYGEENKRPHWHALIFNYSPPDKKYFRKNERGDKIFTSEIIKTLWGKGNIDFGAVTMDSANYVARYAAKKLVHGKDQDHNYHPEHHTSSYRAIGRDWIEKNWKHTFQNGHITLPNGQKSKIPRYYVDWLKKHGPKGEYFKYYTGVREEIIQKTIRSERKKELNHLTNIMNYKGGRAYPLTTTKIQEKILQRKFKQLQEKLKL